LDSTNREHVIPDALGGPNAFTVLADSKMNSSFGSGIDAYLINNFMSRSIASRLGVQTRSGPATFTLSGVNNVTGTPVHARIRKGEFDFKFTNNSVTDPETGELIGFVGMDADAEKALERANIAKEKRGTGAFIAGEAEQIDSTFSGVLKLDLGLLAKGLLKTGYLTAVFTLGDKFILSEGGREMLDQFSRDSHEKTSFFRISNDLVDELLIDLGLLDGLEEKHHLVGCLQLSNKFIIIVRLFSCPLLTAIYEIEGPPMISLGVGMFYAIDSLDASIRRTVFGHSDHELRV
jgi:hypothetical protein